MKKILFCLILLPCLIQAQRLTVDSVLLKKQGAHPAKWVSVKTFSAIDTTTRTKVLTRKATDSLINYALTGVVDTKGNWDASGNTLPSVGVKTGDKWTISVKGFVSPDSFYVGDVIIAKIDDPGQTVTNWNHIYASQPKSVNIVRADATTNLSVVGYTGTTPTQGYWHGGSSNPIGTNYTLNFNGILRPSQLKIGAYNVKPLTTTNSTVYNLSFVSPVLSLGWLNTRTMNAFYTGTTFPNTNSRLNYCGYLYPNGLNIQNKAIIDSLGYLHNDNPTFSSVFFDSTRVIELDFNTPKIISNTWGNLWPNSVLVGFTENKDTAIVGYTGNYNVTMDLNAYVGASANFRYYVKKRAANSTAKTTVYRKEVSNSGTTVNRNMTLNYDFSVGDRIWIEVENISNGTDITVYGGTYSITANYLNP